MHSNSTAANPESKKYCHEAGRRAVEDHLNRMGIEAQVQLSKLLEDTESDMQHQEIQ